MSKGAKTQIWNTKFLDMKDFWPQRNAHDIFMELSDNLTQGKANQNILVPLCGRSKLTLMLAQQGHSYDYRNGMVKDSDSDREQMS